MSKLFNFIKGVILPEDVDKERREKILGDGIIDTWKNDEKERKLKEAKEIGWSSFRLAGEEKAVGFYEKQGAKLIGRIQSRLGKDIFLPHMEYVFDRDLAKGDETN